jgi:hypothetical protein
VISDRLLSIRISQDADNPACGGTEDPVFIAATRSWRLLTHYSGLRGVRHRGSAFCCGTAQHGKVDVEDSHRRGPQRSLLRLARAPRPICPRGRSRAGRAACRPCGPACTVAFPPMTRRHPGMYSDMYPHAHPGRRAATSGLPARPTASLPACGCAWPRSCRLDVAQARRAGVPSS